MNKLYLLFIPLVYFSFCNRLFSQTVGAIVNSSDASQGLTLLSGVNSKDTYLIDNCGNIYNQWSSEYTLGMASYLDDNGNLYRGGKLDTPDFNAGGKGGVIERYSWNGSLLWAYRLANDSTHLHHDFELMPNGNLLITAWDLLSFSEVVSLGRDSLITSTSGFYSETIIEIDPENKFSEVWKWRAIDHIIQDRNTDITSFGSIEDNPQRLDINLNEPSNLSAPVDWLHINSIDYNPTTDQILLSCNAIDEIIIIDHSASTIESSTSSGGNSDMGGDLIFRWGNPNNYIRSITLDRELFKQHDATWIIEDDEYTDRVLLFNNGLKLDELNYSTVDEIKLSKIGFYHYDFESSVLSQQDDRVWSYNRNADKDMFSKRMSGAIRIKSNRTIISESDSGRIFEIDSDGNVLWSYVNPVGSNTIFSQGDVPFANTIFKAANYPASFFKINVESTPIS